MSHWIGDLSQGCDICKRPFGRFMYDAKTTFGPWANLDEACFVLHGMGMGQGRGQKYEKQEDGSYLKMNK